MTDRDTVTGKYRARWEFVDEYAEFDLPEGDRLEIVSPPDFSSERDAQAAEDLAEAVFMRTLEAFRRRYGE